MMSTSAMSIARLQDRRLWVIDEEVESMSQDEGSMLNDKLGKEPKVGALQWMRRNWTLLVMLALAAFSPTRLMVSSIAQEELTTTQAHRTISPYTSVFEIEYDEKMSARRRLEGETIAPTKVSYETQLEVYLCNPTLDRNGNDAYRVDEEHLVNALSRIEGIGESPVENIVVKTSTQGQNPEDMCYKCSSPGMLQWHAQVKYTAAAAVTAETTPAIMAASANDYVAYYTDEFKTLLTAYINDETLYTEGTAMDPLDLSSSDIVLQSVGWTVQFIPGTVPGVLPDTYGQGSPSGMVQSITGKGDLWPWWVWFIYCLVVGICLVPLCCLVFKKHHDGVYEDEHDIYGRKRRDVEGLHRIYGPQWGITEMDFDANYLEYDDEEMKIEYKGVSKLMSRTPGFFTGRKDKDSTVRAHQGVGDAAWVQESGRRPAWSSPGVRGAGGRGDHGHMPEDCRFDIDDDEGDIEGLSNLRGMHPSYSFDAHAGRGRGRGRERSEVFWVAGRGGRR
ncbi:unnamed protein product [Discosporangium mesarthrocarpum]